MRGAPGVLTLDKLFLPRYKLKRGGRQAFAVASGADAITSPGNRAVGMIILILFSPLLAMLAVVVGAAAIPVTLVMLLFPAGRRKLRAQKYKWRNPLRLEIDREFLAPGEEAEAALMVDKIGNLERIAVHIVCEERASYTRGTDRYTDKHRAYDEQRFLMDLEHPGVSPQVRREDKGDWVFKFQVPETAMHSFKGSNNEVVWMLEVRRQYANASEVRDEFGVMVYPIGVCEGVLRGQIAGPAPEGSAPGGAGRRDFSGGRA